MKKKGFTATVVLNKARIAELTSACIQALEDTAQYAEKSLIDSETIPYRTGKLQSSLSIKSTKKGSFNLYHTAPYAMKVHDDTGRTFSRAINANAQAQWLLNFKATHTSKLVDYYIQAFRKRGKV